MTAEERLQLAQDKLGDLRDAWQALEDLACEVNDILVELADEGSLYTPGEAPDLYVDVERFDEVEEEIEKSLTHLE